MYKRRCVRTSRERGEVGKGEGGEEGDNLNSGTIEFKNKEASLQGSWGGGF